MTDTLDAKRLLQLRSSLARLTANAPPEGGANDEVVAAWRECIHDLPDALLDEELVRLLELIHHKL